MQYCLLACLSVYPSICRSNTLLFASPPLCLSICMSAHLSLHICSNRLGESIIHLRVHLYLSDHSVHPSMYPCMHPCMHACMHASIHPSIYHPSIYPSSQPASQPACHPSIQPASHRIWFSCHSTMYRAVISINVLLSVVQTLGYCSTFGLFLPIAIVAAISVYG